MAKERSSSRRPRRTDSERCCTFNAWRMAERARLETAKVSQSGFGRPCSAVMISTVCPDSSGIESGAKERSTRQAMQWLPTSVCTV